MLTSQSFAFYTTPSELVDFPVIFGHDVKVREYRSKGKKVAVLGQMSDIYEPQEVVILVASDNHMPPRDESHIVYEYRDHAKKLNHTATIAYCTEELIQQYRDRGASYSKTASLAQDKNGELIDQFYKLLANALDRNASDIHLEVRRAEALVRFRVDSELYLVKEMPVANANRFAQAVYSVVAEEKDVTFKIDQPQDALIDTHVNGERVRVRWSNIPAAPDGYDCVMRILRLNDATASSYLSLDALGYSKEHSRLINDAISKPQGAIVIAGTTGSGKSTTVKNMLQRLIEESQHRIKVITVEDPPEYMIPGATQVPVSRNKKHSDGSSSFLASVRASLRSDPDIIMVGEVRDDISADLLVQSVESGHQVFTTVHAPSAIGIVSRLASMKVKRDVLGSIDFVACLIYQALLKKLCPHCKIPLANAVVDDALLGRIQQVSNDMSNIYLRGEGCRHCNNGIKGKTVVAEVIVPDFVMRRHFYDSREIDAFEHWLSSGGKRIIQHGIEKMHQGLVSPVDVEDILGMLTSQREMEAMVAASQTYSHVQTLVDKTIIQAPTTATHTDAASTSNAAHEAIVDTFGNEGLVTIAEAGQLEAVQTAPTQLPAYTSPFDAIDDDMPAVASPTPASEMPDVIVDRQPILALDDADDLFSRFIEPDEQISVSAASAQDRLSAFDVVEEKPHADNTVLPLANVAGLADRYHALSTFDAVEDVFGRYDEKPQSESELPENNATPSPFDAFDETDSQSTGESGIDDQTVTPLNLAVIPEATPSSQTKLEVESLFELPIQGVAAVSTADPVALAQPLMGSVTDTDADSFLFKKFGEDLSHTSPLAKSDSKYKRRNPFDTFEADD